MLQYALVCWILDSVYWIPVLKNGIGLGPGHHLAEFPSAITLHSIHPALVSILSSLRILHAMFWLIFELTDKGRRTDST